MPKFSEQNVELVAAMLTDDPDVLVNDDVVLNEYFNRKPTGNFIQRQLAPLLDKNQIAKIGFEQAMADLEQEFQAFVRYQPSIKAAGTNAAIAAFVQYKRTKRLPTAKNPADMDKLGGKDWRHDQPV